MDSGGLLAGAAEAAAAEAAGAYAPAPAPSPVTTPTKVRPGQGSPHSVVEVMPTEEDIAAVLGSFGGSQTVSRAIRGPAPTDPLPGAYRKGVLRQLALNFLSSLATMSDVAVAEAALRIAQQDPAMLSALSAPVLRSVVAFVESKGSGAMPA